MHELSLCKNMMEIVINHVNRKTDKQIKIIHIEMGELTAIEQAAFTFSFDIIKKGTILEDTVLNIITILGQAYCHDCQQVIGISSYHQPCIFCGNFSLKIISGQELRVKSVGILTRR